jgi:acetyl esterase/lipase
MSTSIVPPADPEVERAWQLIPADLQTAATGVRDLAGLLKLREVNARYPVPDSVLVRDGAIDLREITLPRPGATDIRLLVLTPAGPDENRKRPCIFHTHGGGYVSGDNRVGLLRLLDWVLEFDAVLVSPDYQLAPEHPHPAAVEDCYAGLVFAADHAEHLGIDVSRIVVAGASAGGGLAATMALLARDRQGPPVLAQMLFCPMLDDRMITPSSSFEGIPWDAPTNATAWNALLGRSARGSVSPYASPARAASLFSLPPAYLDVGSAEIFRDETIEYATRLMLAGVPTELHVWAGGRHGFDLAAPTAEVSRAAKAAQASYYRRVLEAAAGG